MPRRFIDISSTLKAGIASDPPHMRPGIDYKDHRATAPSMAEYMGVPVEALPEGEYAAVEQATISTHNGTHMDAPYHYFSRMDEALVPGGRPSMRIDEVPLEWCHQPGVKLDFRHFPDGYVATAAWIGGTGLPRLSNQIIRVLWEHKRLPEAGNEVLNRSKADRAPNLFTLTVESVWWQS